MHGSRNRSVEAAVLRSCCCLKQRIPLMAKCGNQDTTRNPTGGLLEIPKHVEMRIPLGVLQVDS